MANQPLPVLTERELELLCSCNGTAPCGNAQADGVPCSALGRPCERCGEAVALLREVAVHGTAVGAATASAAPEPDGDSEFEIVPTEIGA